MRVVAAAVVVVMVVWFLAAVVLPLLAPVALLATVGFGAYLYGKHRRQLHQSRRRGYLP